MRYCKVCKKPANEVDIIHRRGKYSGMVPGSCLNCQDLHFLGFLFTLFGIAGAIAGLVLIFKGDYFTLLVSIALFFFGLTFPDIVGSFYKEDKGKL